MQNQSVGLYEKIFLIVLFCFAVSLFNMSGYIFSAIVLGMFILLYITGKFRLLYKDLGLALFSVTYFFFYWLYYGLSVNAVILYLIGPWAAYILGRVYIEHSEKSDAFMTFLLVISAGMFLHGVLNVIAYMRSEHFLLYTYYRQSVDFWRGDLVNVKSTEMLYTFASSMGLGVMFTTYPKKYKVLSAVVFAVSLILTVFLANRALMIIAVVVFLWNFLGWFADRRMATSRKVLILMGGVLVATAMIVLIAMNVAGMQDAFFELKIVQRFTSEAELTRFEVWELFFENFAFIEYPFGGKFLTQYSLWGYLHNMWLDVYNVVGVVPFVILIALTVSFFNSFRRFSRVMKAAKRKDELIIFRSMILAIALNMMVEPIIEANPYYFLMVLMFLGAMETHTAKVARSVGPTCTENQVIEQDAEQ